MSELIVSGFLICTVKVAGISRWQCLEMPLGFALLAGFRAGEMGVM
ncbi:hypothetical protein ACWEPB_26525 [Kitasatospora cineracea]